MNICLYYRQLVKDGMEGKASTPLAIIFSLFSPCLSDKRLQRSEVSAEERNSELKSVAVTADNPAGL